jgi:general secretion pathway protein C
MEAVLKKQFWVINLVFLGFAAWLMAGSINGVVAHKLREIPSLSQAMPTQNSTGRSSEAVANYQEIIDRNYFNSAMSLPVEAVENGPGIDETSGKELLEGDGVESSLRASLVGTIVAEPSDWSMAMITDQTSSETSVYRVNDRLLGEATVVAILTQRVVINHNGVREYLELQEETGAKGSRPKPARPTTAQAPSEPSVGEGIKKTGEDTWSIERGEIEKTLSNLNSIAMQARIVPSFKNGEANGFKLFAIRPGSLYSKIGIQNGDIIHKINGFAINSPDKALEVYQKLKAARGIEVELTRRGQSKNLTYNIE